MSKTQQIKIDEYEFEVLFHEAPKNKGYLFFLHGYPDDLRSWEAQIEYLKDDFGIIAPNLPGVGKSAKPPLRIFYNAQRLCPTLAKLAEKLVPDQSTPIQLIGHDWGSILLWALVSDEKLAARFLSFTAIAGPHVALVRELMLSRLTSGVYVDLENLIKQFFKSWYIYLFQLPNIPELAWNFLAEPLWEMMLTMAEAPANDIRRTYSREEIINRATGPINLYRELLQGKEIPLPDKIRLPVQIIVPERDLAITPEVYDDHYRYVTGLKIHRIDANHWVQIEKPSEVSRLIYSFAYDQLKSVTG